MNLLGIDIGGSGIKGAVADLEKGEFVTDRVRIDTPDPSKPEAVAEVVAEIVRSFEWTEPFGCTFPAVVKRGTVLTAANVHKSWIGVDAESLFAAKTGCPVLVLNDADAAGLAEMRFGAGRGRGGEVIVLTLGTGIGSAIFVDGVLVPNTELGHLELRGKDAEKRAAAAVRKQEGLTWTEFGERVNEYLQAVEALLSPDLFIIGGGVSRRHDRYFSEFDLSTEVVPAELANQAGIVGAALAAAERDG